MSAEPLRVTPLHDVHRAAGARMVPFAGWDMPLHYGSQLDEHHATRRAATVFDVSHMLAVEVTGADALRYLSTVFANDVTTLVPGAALYTCLLNEAGGVLDDLIVYCGGEDAYRIVVNAGTADADLAWLTARRDGLGYDATLTPRRDLALLAVQGPAARERCHTAWAVSRAGASLQRFHAALVGETWIARTGYTGEDGYELMLPASEAVACWNALTAVGVQPAGLGARDTLRLEAGLALYGQDMDPGVTPYECGLAWTVALQGGRRFIGRDALENHTATRAQCGLVLLDKGVMRAHQTVKSAYGEGVVTSGGFGPTIGASIALARLPASVRPGDEVEVTVRDRALRARVVTPPFVRSGRVRVSVTG